MIEIDAVTDVINRLRANYYYLSECWSFPFSSIENVKLKCLTVRFDLTSKPNQTEADEFQFDETICTYFVTLNSIHLRSHFESLWMLFASPAAHGNDQISIQHFVMFAPKIIINSNSNLHQKSFNETIKTSTNITHCIRKV